MLSEIIRGLSTTLKSMLEKPVTIQYPEVKRPVRRRFKGRHRLERYENGLEICIGCSLCAAACPADAIFVEAAENTDDERYSPGPNNGRPIKYQTYVDTNDFTNSISTVQSDEDGMWYFSLAVNGSAAPGTYKLRVVDANENPIANEVYTLTPTLEIVSNGGSY